MHACQVRRACILRQLRQVLRSVLIYVTKAVTHAFISSRLDYCNSLYVWHLQVQHPAPVYTGCTGRCSTLDHWRPKV